MDRNLQRRLTQTLLNPLPPKHPLYFSSLAFGGFALLVLCSFSLRRPHLQTLMSEGINMCSVVHQHPQWQEPANYPSPDLLLMDHMVSGLWVEECREFAFANTHTPPPFFFF